MDLHDLQKILMFFLAFILLLTALPPPLQEMYKSLQRRLFPNFHGARFHGRDVFSLIADQRWLFWRNTGETPDSFLQIVQAISLSLFRLTVHGQQRVRQRRQKLSLANQILLVMIWIRKYPQHPTSVIRIFYKIIPELWQYFSNQIEWPTVQEWTNMMGNWPEFPNVIGTIDSTPHRIYRPLTEPQRLYYSGHRHYHCMHTQIIIDNEGHIRFLQSGFLGRTHDSQSFRLMGPIGALPPNAKFLADKGYFDGGPLLTAVRPNQMRALNQRDSRRARKFNRRHRRRRVKVEHVIKEVKTFKAVSQLWRHPRWLMPVCVELAVFLAERRLRLFDAV